MRARPMLLAVAAGLVLADGSIVTLGLPEILRDLETTVEGVAAVIGVYTVVLAGTLLALERAAHTVSVRAMGAGGLAVMALASVLCATADELAVLLLGRAAQGVGGAAGIVAAFAALGGGAGPGRRAWLTAAVLGTAVGPALGGALTEAFSWRAIFLAQAPLVAAAAAAVLAGPALPLLRDGRRTGRFAPRPTLALGLVSAALSAVLFLLVLLLVAGWSLSPLRAAATVTVVPLAALAGTRIRGPAATRAATGCALVAGGVLALAWLPSAQVAWTLLPQGLAGAGMGLSLTALAGGLLPEETAHDAARTLAVRHAGIALALAVLAPVVAAQFDAATQRAREQGVALLLDAPLDPQKKLELAPTVLDAVSESDARGGLQRAVARERSRFSGAELGVYDRLARRADETLTTGVADAFREAFVLMGVLALVAAVALAPWRGPGRVPSVVTAAGLLAVLAPLGHVVAHRALAPEPVTILDPCTAERRLPRTAGPGGFLQDRVLEALDDTACRLGSSREELVLALADEGEARRFRAEHGADPRAAAGLLRGLLGG